MREQHAQLLLDTGMIDRSFINAATCKKLGISLQVPPSTQEHGEADKPATSTVVYPKEFPDTPPGTSRLCVDTAIPPHMLTPITYGNGPRASPTSIIAFTL